MTRELDRQVSEAMGWHLEGVRWFQADGADTGWRDITDWHEWRPSQDIAAAWTLIEHMRERGLFCKITYYWTEDYGVRVSFDEQGVSDPNPLYKACADTAPEAICYAFLAAKEHQP